MQKLQVDIEVLREQREGAIAGAREELQAAQEEALALRCVVETAATERERDIASLQSQLRSVTAELERWRQAAGRYEAEIGALQASFQEQSQQERRVAQLQGSPARHITAGREKPTVRLPQGTVFADPFHLPAHAFLVVVL